MPFPWSPLDFGPFDGGVDPPAPPPPTPPPADDEPAPIFGFGAPSNEQSLLGQFANGFGHPDVDDQDTTPANFGFGDPSDGYATPIVIVGGGPWYPDDGGSILTISGPWSYSWGVPLRVRVVHQGSGTVYPNDATKPLGGMRSPKPGVGVDLPVREDGKVQFCLCPLPVGDYDVQVFYGPSFSSGATLAGAFTVVYRHLSRESWTMRRGLPAHWRGAGPRSIVTEQAPEKNVAFPQLNLRTVTAAIAEACQLAAGKAVTRLTADTEEDAATINVETTLGFFDSGYLIVADREYYYAGRTPTTFTGCYPTQVYDGLALPGGSMVVSQSARWTPTE